MTQDTIEVDREYVWALEVLTLDRINVREGFTDRDVNRAEEIVTNACLSRPIQK